jgi:hypothetical protein
MFLVVAAAHVGCCLLLVPRPLLLLRIWGAACCWCRGHWGAAEHHPVGSCCRVRLCRLSEKRSNSVHMFYGWDWVDVVTWCLQRCWLFAYIAQPCMLGSGDAACLLCKLGAVCFHRTYVLSWMHHMLRLLGQAALPVAALVPQKLPASAVRVLQGCSTTVE